MALSKTQLERRLLNYRQQNWHRVQTNYWQIRIVNDQLNFDAKPLLKTILNRYNLNDKKIKYLDIGSGIGSYVIAARELGIESYGIEPDRIGVGSNDSSLKIACDRIDGPAPFVSAIGEFIPFSNAQFDLITMNQVLEHVQDLKSVLKEALRVLKPGGVLLFNSPNYLSFYEPHYKIFWLPVFPRILAKTYLILRGRDPKFLDGISYITRFKINKILNKIGCKYEDEQISYAEQRMHESSEINNFWFRFIARLISAASLSKPATFIYVNFFIRGLSYVVTRTAEN
jgi:ubiquinone/menaquinone biosynthesis C-methylase UbiE